MFHLERGAAGRAQHFLHQTAVAGIVLDDEHRLAVAEMFLLDLGDHRLRVAVDRRQVDFERGARFDYALDIYGAARERGIGTTVEL